MSILNMFETIFELQVNFQKLLNNPIPNFDGILFVKDINIDLIKNQILALVDESMEALREIPWKPWKVNLNIDLEKYRMELIDIFHFLINLFIFAGMSPIMIFKMFVKKNEINVQRQKDGY